MYFQLAYQLNFSLCQIIIKMSAQKEVYDEDKLSAYVDTNSPFALRAVASILKQKPEKANKLYQGKTLLSFPCIRGYSQMVKVLLNCGVIANNANKNGLFPIMDAVRHNHLDVVKILHEKGAQLEGIPLKYNLRLIDLSIVYGYYEVAFYLYEQVKDNSLKSSMYYSSIAKQSCIRYVNYDIVIEGLRAGKVIHQLPDFLTKKKGNNESESDEQECCDSWCCGLFSTQAKSKSKFLDKHSQKTDNNKIKSSQQRQIKTENEQNLQIPQIQSERQFKQ